MTENSTTTASEEQRDRADAAVGEETVLQGAGAQPSRRPGWWHEAAPSWSRGLVDAPSLRPVCRRMSCADRALNLRPTMRSTTSSRLVSGMAALRDGAALVHHLQPVADQEQVLQAMGDQDDADALGADGADELQHGLHLRHRERRGRLVHDQHLRGEGRGAADGDRLALAARQVLDMNRDVGHRRCRGSSAWRPRRPASASCRGRAGRGCDGAARARGTGCPRHPPCRRARGPGRPSRRAGRAHRPGTRRLTGSPSISIVPLSGTTAPERTLLSVDLPAPLSPTRPRTSPGCEVEGHVVERLDRAVALRDPAHALGGSKAITFACGSFPRTLAIAHIVANPEEGRSSGNPSPERGGWRAGVFRQGIPPSGPAAEPPSPLLDASHLALLLNMGCLVGASTLALVTMVTGTWITGSTLPPFFRALEALDRDLALGVGVLLHDGRRPSPRRCP